MRWLILLATLSLPSGVRAQIRAVTPHDRPANAATGSPGIDAGDYVYVSGQGCFRPDGSAPTNFAAQVRQSLDNVKDVVQAAGLTLNHVVYVQVYLRDMNQYIELNKVFADYFPKDPPARAVLGVARLPQDDAVQITAVAVRDLKGKQPVGEPSSPQNKGYSAGMLTHDRFFVSAMLGSDPSTGNAPQEPAAQVNLALDRMKSVLQAAGLSMANMVFVNPYLTSEVPMQIMNRQYAQRFEFGNTPARATIEVSSLPKARTSPTPAWRCAILAVGAPSGQRTCRRAPLPAHASSLAIPCTVRPKADSFPGRTAVFMARALRTKPARPCETSSTTWRRRR